MRRFMWFSVLLSALTVATSVSAQDIRRALFIVTLLAALLAAEATTPAWSKMGRSYGGGGGSIASPDFGSTANPTVYYVEYQPLSEFQMKLLTAAIRTVLVINVGVAVGEAVVGGMIKATGPAGYYTVLGIGLAKTGATVGILTLMGYEDEVAQTARKKAISLGVGLGVGLVAEELAIQGPWGSFVGSFVSVGFALDALVDEFK